MAKKNKLQNRCKFCFVFTTNPSGFCSNSHRIAFHDLSYNHGNLNRVSIDAIGTKILNTLDFITKVHVRLDHYGVGLDYSDERKNNLLCDLECAKLAVKQIRFLSNSLKNQI